MSISERLLPIVKANLVIEHNADDELLLGYIRAAVDYAESYQKRKYRRKLPPSTEQAIVILASNFYESRDGSTAGFFADNVGAGNAVWTAARRLLDMHKFFEV
jgi:hypothetical protein